MSILIKGMEMPREGVSLFVEVNSTGHIICQYSDDIVHYGYKSRAVPVPTPHGRLIDADALCRIDGKDEDGFSCQIVYDWDIEEAPTIIEAEGGGEDGC